MKKEIEIPVKTVGRPSEYGFEKIIMTGTSKDFLFKDGFSQRKVLSAARNYAKYNNIVFVSRSIKDKKTNKKLGIRITKINDK